jgi:hypothetical protein
VPTCRCGAERADAERAGDPAPVAPAPRPAAAGWWTAHWIAVAEGYAAEARLPAARRILLRTVLGAAIAAVFVATAAISTAEPVPAAGNIRVLARLDEHTRRASDAADVIPSFLALPGALGVLPPTAPDERPVRNADGAVLRRGFCSPSVARLVRFEYPTHYRGLSDARLERAVLEKHPEYRDRLCALPYELDADPEDVIKYELRPRSIPGWMAVSVWTLGVTAAFAAAVLSLYCRFVVPALLEASGPRPGAFADAQ